MVAVMKIGDAPTQADFHEAISARSDRWYSACLKITRNPDLAADAVQDALLNAWNKRHQFESSARLDTWIHRIAINAALTLLRKSKPGVFEPLDTDIEGNTIRPDRAWEEHELESELARALGELTEAERQIWNRYLNTVRVNAEMALPVREALLRVYDPGFPWPQRGR